MQIIQQRFITKLPQFLSGDLQIGVWFAQLPGRLSLCKKLWALREPRWLGDNVLAYLRLAGQPECQTKSGNAGAERPR